MTTSNTIEIHGWCSLCNDAGQVQPGHWLCRQPSAPEGYVVVDPVGRLEGGGWRAEAAASPHPGHLDSAGTYIYAALAPVNETLEEAMARGFADPMRALRRLVEAGRVTSTECVALGALDEDDRGGDA